MNFLRKITPKRAFIMGIIAESIFMLGVLLVYTELIQPKFDDVYGRQFHMPDIILNVCIVLPYISGALFCFGLIGLFIYYKSKLLRIAVILNILSSIYAGTIYLLNWISVINFFNIYHAYGFIFNYIIFVLPVILIFMTLAFSFFRLFESPVMRTFSILVMLYSAVWAILFIFDITLGYATLYYVKIFISPAKLFLYIGALIAVAKETPEANKL